MGSAMRKQSNAIIDMSQVPEFFCSGVSEIDCQMDFVRIPFVVNRQGIIGAGEDSTHSTEGVVSIVLPFSALREIGKALATADAAHGIAGLRFEDLPAH